MSKNNIRNVELPSVDQGRDRVLTLPHWLQQSSSLTETDTSMLCIGMAHNYDQQLSNDSNTFRFCLTGLLLWG